MAGWPAGRLLSTAARLVGLTHAGLIVLHLLDIIEATSEGRFA